MRIAVNREQLLSAVESLGFQIPDAEQIIGTLEAQGRIELTGSMVNVRNPSDPDGPMIAGLCQHARGASPGSVGTYKIREYLAGLLSPATTRGGSGRSRGRRR